METMEGLKISPCDLAVPFVRLDAGDVTELIELDILMDLPDVLSLVRFHFRSGVGYEVISSSLCEMDTYQDAINVMNGAQLIRTMGHGHTYYGHPQIRSWLWGYTSPQGLRRLLSR